MLLASREGDQPTLFKPDHAPRELDNLQQLADEAEPWLLLCSAQEQAVPAEPDADTPVPDNATSNPAGGSVGKGAFGFSWFIPELLRHRNLWRDVLLASLAIQLVGLATPLFTQVIIDKVIAHHRQVGSYTTSEGEVRSATDVWVQTNPTQSLPTEWLAVPADIAALPDAQGYGLVRDLHQAMAADASGELQALVQAFTQAQTPQERDELLTELIYHWAGVQDVDPTSRASRMIYGNAIGDARRLEALEQFMGQEWVGVWCWGTLDPNPHGRAAPVLLQAWSDLKALVYGQLMAQTQLQGLFQQIRYRWDPPHRPPPSNSIGASC